MLLYVWLVLPVAKEKTDDSGLPFMTLYELKEYGAPTNTIVQDKRGVIYLPADMVY
jgi:hypothetical protein